ncbi:putative cation efflux protein [Plasmopara halstedii]
MDLIADGSGFHNSPVALVAGAACSLLRLGLLQSLLLYTTRTFSVLAQLLLLQLMIHAVIYRGSKSFKFDSQRLTLSAAHRLASLYVAVQALCHFGLLFAFLLQHADVLLLHIKRWYGVGDRNSSLLLLLGYVLVAGVNADKYGAFLHTILLIGASVGLHLAAHSLMLQADGDVSLVSIAGATILAALLAFVTPADLNYARYTANDRASADEGVMSSSTWTIYLVAAAVSHFASTSLRRQFALLSTRDQEKAQLMFTITGILLAIVIAFLNFGWLRASLLAVSCSLIVYVMLRTWQRLGTLSRQEGDLDTYRRSSACRSENGGLILSASQVLAVLWAKRASRQMLIFLSINVAFMFIEFGVGLYTNSLGLMGDAGHMLFDNGALVIGLVASYIGQLPPDPTFTYGYGRVEVLSGFLNSLLLLVVSFHLITEAASRFTNPPEVTTDHLLLTSTAGLLVNLVGLFFFHEHVHGHSHSHESNNKSYGSGHGHSHGVSHHQAHGEIAFDDCQTRKNSNMYGVYLHILADTLGSVGVIISSILIHLYEWHVADSASSALISLLILTSTLPLIRDTARQLLQGAPREIQGSVNAALQEVQSSIPGVERIAQWNIWHHAGNMHVATLHLEVAVSADEQQILLQTQYIFRRHARLDEFLSVQISKPKLISTIGHEGLMMTGCSADHGHNYDHSYDLDHIHSCHHAHNHNEKLVLNNGIYLSVPPHQHVSGIGHS